MADKNSQLEALHDIRRMMQRSSRFISLSGLSGIAAGCWALIGAFVAHKWINAYRLHNSADYTQTAFHELKFRLFILSGAVLGLSLVTAIYFTWRKAGKENLPLWDHTAKNLVFNMMIPLLAGGLFILAMLQLNDWRLVAPACLIFYGLALTNGSKYTLSEVRYLGIMEVLLGLINTQFIGYGLYFWAMGFGWLHIIYGFAMWWKYEHHSVVSHS